MSNNQSSYQQECQICGEEAGPEKDDSLYAPQCNHVICSECVHDLILVDPFSPLPNYPCPFCEDIISEEHITETDKNQQGILSQSSPSSAIQHGTVKQTLNTHTNSGLNKNVVVPDSGKHSEDIKIPGERYTAHHNVTADLFGDQYKSKGIPERSQDCVKMTLDNDTIQSNAKQEMSYATNRKKKVTFDLHANQTLLEAVNANGIGSKENGGSGKTKKKCSDQCIFCIAPIHNLTKQVADFTDRVKTVHIDSRYAKLNSKVELISSQGSTYLSNRNAPCLVKNCFLCQQNTARTDTGS